MARPIRDDPTRTAPTGDPVRAYTRFTEGHDWLDHGTSAMVRAGADIATVVAERQRRQDTLADAVATTNARAAVQTRVQERIRDLDPRQADYIARVEAISQEELRRATDTANFVLSGTRERFEAELSGFGGQVRLSALDRRERALVDDAKLQATAAINQAAAAASAGGSPGRVMLDLEARLAPILGAIDPQARDAILQTAKTTVAGEAVKALVDRRDFAGAEAMLSNYGGQGLLGPGDVRAIRSGIEREKRQAAVEARVNQRMAEADLRDGIATASTPQEAQAVLDRAIEAGVVRPGSPLVQSLQRRITVAMDSEHRNILSTVLEGEDLIARGVALSDQQEVALLRAAESVAAESAERQLRLTTPGASAEAVRDARVAAVLRERERLTVAMVQARPTQLPLTVRQEGERVLTYGSPEAQANFIERLVRVTRTPDGTLPDAARKFVAEVNPVLGDLLATAREQGLPLTRETIQTLSLGLQPPLSPEARAVLETQWRQVTGGAIPQISPRDAVADAVRQEMRKRNQTAAVTGAMEAEAVAQMQRAFMQGRPATEAAHIAARFLLDRFEPNALNQEVRVPAAANPARAFPRQLLEEYGLVLTASKMREHILASVTNWLHQTNTAAKARGEVEIPFSALEIVPVAVYERDRPVGIQIAVRDRRILGAAHQTVINSESNRPWTLRTDKPPEELAAQIGLTAAARAALARPNAPGNRPARGGSVSDPTGGAFRNLEGVVTPQGVVPGGAAP